MINAVSLVTQARDLQRAASITTLYSIEVFEEFTEDTQCACSMPTAQNSGLPEVEDASNEIMRPRRICLALPSPMHVTLNFNPRGAGPCKSHSKISRVTPAAT